MIDLVDTAPDTAATLRRREALLACWLTGWQPHPGQLEALDVISRGRFSALVCGRRWGKSHLAARLAIAELLKPNRVVWCCAPMYELARRIHRPVAHLLKHVVPGELAKHGLPKVTVKRAVESQAERIVELSNGSIFQSKSTDSKDSLLGEGLDLCILEEAALIEQRAWEEALLPSLLDKGGRAVLIGTPRGANWFHDCYARGQDPADLDWTSLRSPSATNPHLPAKAIEQFRKSMSPASFAQELLADFVSMSGRVFGDFTREANVCRVEMDPWLPVDVGLDFGYRTSALLAAQKYQSAESAPVLRVFWSAELKDTTTDRIAAHLLAQPFAGRLKSVNVDPAGSAANLQSGMSDVRVLREAFRDRGVTVGYSMQRDHRNPEWRCARLRDLICAADGTRRLFVDPSCREVIRALDLSTYPDIRAGSGEKTDPVKDGVVDHMRDALGYLVVNVFHRHPIQMGGERPW